MKMISEILGFTLFVAVGIIAVILIVFIFTMTGIYSILSVIFAPLTKCPSCRRNEAHARCEVQTMRHFLDRKD